MSITRHGPGANLSRAVEHDGTIYLSGLTAEDKSADMAGQTAQILARIERNLAEAGSDKSHLLSATIYLSDMSRKEEMNRVWQGWIDPKHPPARATVGVDLGGPKVLVEIMVTAAKR
jgi:enamine deaminase RidA (YjgF/YER057c/UK114 family)